MAPVEYTGKLDGGTLYQGSLPNKRLRKVWFNYAATQVYVGSIVMFSSNADPENAAFCNYYPGVSVELPSADLAGLSNLAGIIVDLGKTSGSADGWITIEQPVRGDIVTLAVAASIHMVDYANLAAAAVCADGSTTQALLNVAKPLYDEGNANNPHGVAALGTGLGLVEAVWIGGRSAS
jgi:hypothetical protein